MPEIRKVPMVDDKGKPMTNHLWIPGKHGEVYCYRYDKDVVLKNWFDQCSECPYFAGTVQGEGIECAYGKGAPQVKLE